MSCRGVLVVTHTEGAARASRGHERLGGVQPLRLLGLDEVVDDGVEEGACARSAVQVRTHAGARQRRGCWGHGCWGEGCWGPGWPWPRALGGVEARPGRAGKPRAGQAPGGQRPGRAEARAGQPSYAGHLETGGDAADGHGAAEHLEGRHALAWLGLGLRLGLGLGLGLGFRLGLGLRARARA